MDFRVLWGRSSAGDVAGYGALAKTGGYQQTWTYNVDGSVAVAGDPSHPGLPTGFSEAVNYRYTPTGQVANMFGASLMVRDSVYDPQGRLVRRTSGPTDRPEVWDFRAYEEATGRLASHVVTRQNTNLVPVLDWAYGYDAAGNVTSLADTTVGEVWRQCFTYDHHRRLSVAWTQSAQGCVLPSGSAPDLGATAPYWDSFTYDLGGSDEAGGRGHWHCDGGCWGACVRLWLQRRR